VEAKKHFDVLDSMLKRPPGYVDREHLKGLRLNEGLKEQLEYLGGTQKLLEGQVGKIAAREAVRKAMAELQGMGLQGSEAS
jgi:hypothetical protein